MGVCRTQGALYMSTALKIDRMGLMQGRQFSIGHSMRQGFVLDA